MIARFHVHITLRDDKDARIFGHRCMEEPSIIYIDDFCVEGETYSNDHINEYLQSHQGFLARSLEPRFKLKPFTISEIKHDIDL